MSNIIMKGKYQNGTYVLNTLKTAAELVSRGWEGSNSKDTIVAKLDFLSKVVNAFDMVIPKECGLDTLAWSDDTGAYVDVTGTTHHFRFSADDIIPEGMTLKAAYGDDQPSFLTDSEIAAIQSSVKSDVVKYITEDPAAEIQAGYTSRCELVVVVKPSHDYAETRRAMMRAVGAAVAAANDPATKWNPDETDDPYREFPGVAYAGMAYVLKSKVDNLLLIDMCDKVGKDLAKAYPDDDDSDDSGVVYIENHYDCVYGGLTGRAFDDAGGYTYPAFKD